MPEAKRKIQWSSAWLDARELVWAHRRRLILGAVLMIVNQAMGLVLPASTKYLIDVVIGQGRTDLLWKIALAAGSATIIQALTSFSLSQVLGVAAQRAITDMRKKVQAQISRLSIYGTHSTTKRNRESYRARYDCPPRRLNNVEKNYRMVEL